MPGFKDSIINFGKLGFPETGHFVGIQLMLSGLEYCPEVMMCSYKRIFLSRKSQCHKFSFSPDVFPAIIMAAGFKSFAVIVTSKLFF